MDLLLHHVHHHGPDVLTVEGEIDLYSVPQLRQVLHELVDDQPKDVVIDLGEVAFIDSMGLGVLVGGFKRARLAGGTVRLAGPQQLVAKALRVTGLVKVFSIYPDVTQALATPHDLPPASDQSDADVAP